MVTELQTQGLGEFARFNFTLKYPGDHTLELHHDNILVARFNQTKVTEEKLQEECILHLTREHGWDGCLWSNAEKKADG